MVCKRVCSRDSMTTPDLPVPAEQQTVREASHVSYTSYKVKVWTTAHYCLCLSAGGAADSQGNYTLLSHSWLCSSSLTVWLIFKEISPRRKTLCNFRTVLFKMLDIICVCTCVYLEYHNIMSHCITIYCNYYMVYSLTTKMCF